MLLSLFRFREELGVFDEMELSPSTLEVVEPYLKKPHFNTDYLERKTNNPAVGSLLLWVRGVVRYVKLAATALPTCVHSGKSTMSLGIHR